MKNIKVIFRNGQLIDAENKKQMNIFLRLSYRKIYISGQKKGRNGVYVNVCVKPERKFGETSLLFTK